MRANDGARWRGVKVVKMGPYVRTSDSLSPRPYTSYLPRMNHESPMKPTSQRGVSLASAAQVAAR